MSAETSVQVIFALGKAAASVHEGSPGPEPMSRMLTASALSAAMSLTCMLHAGASDSKMVE